jgi:hypothetical protein
MPIAVTKEGPYFSSGSISFSQLRSTFKETSSGKISASELRRNTNPTETDPIVPDSTENENISSENNLRIGGFRNSVKRYYARQTGTDHNLNNSGEPGLRLGRVKPDGSGIDWSGGGITGRDREGSSDGNYTRNIQKFISIEGECGSYYTNQPAAQLSPGVKVYNTTFTISGQIYGAAGAGGGPASPGGGGGPAVNIQYDQGGVRSIVNITSSARIYGGGNGGAGGSTGENGIKGSCGNTYTTRLCNSSPSGCNSGDQDLGVRDDGCCRQRRTLGIKNGCDKWKQRTCYHVEASSTPTGGLGGSGGNGQGYGVGASGGTLGSKGTCPTCPTGQSLLGPSGYGTCGKDGEKGGDGGGWGGGPAFIGSYYVLRGNLNSETIKGSYNAS